jgi:hypothetical protein
VDHQKGVKNPPKQPGADLASEWQAVRRPRFHSASHAQHFSSIVYSIHVQSVKSEISLAPFLLDDPRWSGPSFDKFLFGTCEEIQHKKRELFYPFFPYSIVWGNRCLRAMTAKLQPPRTTPSYPWRPRSGFRFHIWYQTIILLDSIWCSYYWFGNLYVLPCIIFHMAETPSQTWQFCFLVFLKIEVRLIGFRRMSPNLCT